MFAKDSKAQQTNTDLPRYDEGHFRVQVDRLQNLPLVVPDSSQPRATGR